MKTIFTIFILLLISSIFCTKYTELQMNKLYNIETKGEDFSYFKISLKRLSIIPNEITIQTQIIKMNSFAVPILGVNYEPIKLDNYQLLLKTEIGKPLSLNTTFIKSSLLKRHEIYFAVYSPNSQYSLKIIPNGDIKSQTVFVQTPTPNKNVIPTSTSSTTIPTPKPTQSTTVTSPPKPTQSTTVTSPPKPNQSTTVTSTPKSTQSTTVTSTPKPNQSNTATQNPTTKPTSNPSSIKTPPPTPKMPNVRTLAEENNALETNITEVNNTQTRMEFYSADGVSALFVAFIMIFVSLIGCEIMMNIYVHSTALVEQPLKLGKIEA